MTHVLDCGLPFLLGGRPSWLGSSWARAGALLTLGEDAQEAMRINLLRLR